MEYVLQNQVQEVPNWLVDQYFGLWHVLEFAGVLSSIFFMVSLVIIIMKCDQKVFLCVLFCILILIGSVHDDVAILQ